MRPHRNPETVEQYTENFQWRAQQFLLPPEGRDDEAMFQPAWQIDNEQYMMGNGRRFVADRMADAWLQPVYPRLDDGRRLEGLRARPRERDRGVATNADMVRRNPELRLDKLPDGPDIPRDIKLPPFKIDYDSHEQINQKLSGTVILIKNQPFVVSETAEHKKGKFALLVYNTDRDPKVVYYDDVADCRGIAPGYFAHRGGAYWTYRVPERQNSQGMCQRNMKCKLAGENHDSPARVDFLLGALGVVKDVQYAPNLHDMILGGAAHSIRLTDKVALYSTKKKGAPIGVEYVGRPLGLIVNGVCKVFDECDLMPSWIHKDVHKAGLALTA